MTEYINRAELIENLNKFAPEHYNALINQLITKQPTADVQEVIHAKFELVNNGKGVCSNCHRLDSIDKLAKYCKYCGARMDGDEK